MKFLLTSEIAKALFAKDRKGLVSEKKDGFVQKSP